jgi:hypothetical protein
MGGERFGKDLQKIPTWKSGKCPIPWGRSRVWEPLANVLTKIEQTQVEKCQYSEYLTLLSSFPDVKKSV